MPDDFLSMVGDPTPEDLLRAQIAALRRQNDPRALEQQKNAGFMLSAMMHPGLQKMGGEMVSNAQNMSGETTPRLMAAMKQLQEGPQKDLGGKTPDVFKLLMQEKATQKYAPNPGGAPLYDVHTGKPAPGQKAGAEGGAGGLDPAALDQIAEMFHRTGQLPPMGMGAAGTVLRRQVMNRAAALHPEADLAGNKLSYHADTGSLAGLQKQADAVDAFEATAGKNLDQFLGIAKGVVDTGSPLINKPVRFFDEKVLGDPKMAAFNVARTVAVNEIAKVLSNPGMSGTLTDSARAEVGHLIGPNATLAQIYQAAKILKTDMANRKASMAEQLGAIRGRSGGQRQATAAPDVAPEGKQVLKYQQNKAKGVKRAVYADGSYGPEEPL